MEADFYQGPSWNAPAVDYSVEHGEGTLSINQQSANQLMTNSDNIWKLKLSDEVPIDLEVDVGAGQRQFEPRSRRSYPPGTEHRRGPGATST